MGFEDDPAVRTAGRLAALAMARGCVEGMFQGRSPEGAADAAGLFLAGRPLTPDDLSGLDELPDEVAWLIGASAQVLAAALYRWAADRARGRPDLAGVLAVCDELETALLGPGLRSAHAQRR